MSNIAQLIVNALISPPSPEVRSQAEQELQNYKNSNVQQFLTLINQELANENNDTKLRQAAGTLMARCIMLQQNGNSDWNLLDLTSKTNIKNSLIQTLISKDAQAKRAAADAISHICTVELPRKEWPEIISSLSQNANHEMLEIKKAAILTLGFICEQLKKTGLMNCLDQQQSEEILAAILQRMATTEDNEDIKYLAITALNNSIAYMEKHLQNQNVRNVTVEYLIMASLHQNKQIAVAALQCLIDFCKIFYDFLGAYIQVLFNKLSEVVMHQDQDIAIPAIEIWNIIATEDKERTYTQNQIGIQQQPSQNFTQLVALQLIPCLLQNLLKIPDDDEGDLNIQETSNRCLQVIIEQVGENQQIIQLFQNFISNTINGPESAKKQASALSFGVLAEISNKDIIQNTLILGLPNVIQLIQDNDVKVKIAAAMSIARIAEAHPEVIVAHSQLQTFLPFIINALQGPINLSKHICWFFNFIAEIFNSVPSNHYIRNQVDSIIQQLINNSYRQDIVSDLNLIDVSYMAIINLIHYLNDANVSAKYLKLFLDLFKQSYTFSMNHKQSLQSGILSALHTCLLRLPDQIDDQTSQQIYEIIINDFKLIGTVSSDGIYVISALATSIRKKFQVFLQNYFQYLTFALQKSDEPELFKSAIGSLADISRATEEGFVQYLQSIIPSLLNCIKSDSIAKDIKLQIFLCVGDITLGVKTEIIPYLVEILSLYDLTFAACVEMSMSNSKDANLIDFVENLKDKLIESYTCFVHALGTCTQSEILLPHFTRLIDFMKKVCQSQYNPTVDFLRNCLTLIVDIANFYGNKVKDIVKTQFSQELINTLNKFNHIKENQETIAYAVQILQVL